ncbi:MAG: helix-turn-helix domain-containing protein [Desulfobacterales bacterium]|nr:helix-turn-helix domain-containing protein [Desulfobacterales bacterium]
MIKKKVLNPKRVRKINGGFSFIPHRFVLDGFLSALGQKELLLYLFLVIVSDRNGVSFYSYDGICTLLALNLDEYITTRDSLIEKDLVAFDGTLFQVLDLPQKCPDLRKRENRSPVEQLIQQTIKSI